MSQSEAVRSPVEIPAMTDQTTTLLAKTFINALRQHPKEMELSLFVAPAVLARHGSTELRRCSEAEVEKALRFALAEYSKE